MSSLIANKVETNMCLVSIKLFIVRTILCATVQTYTTYTTITTCLLFFSAYNLFASNTYSLFFSHNYSLFFSHPYSLDLHSEDFKPQLHTRLNEFLLTSCLLCLALLYAHTFCVQNVLKVEGSRSCLLANSIATACICALSVMLVVVGLFGRCSMYFLVYMCILYTLPLVAFAFVVFALSISFILMIFVLLGFVYCS